MVRRQVPRTAALKVDVNSECNRGDDTLSQSSVSSSIALQAQLEMPLLKFQDSNASSSADLGAFIQDPGRYIATDSLRSVIPASSDVNRDLTGSDHSNEQV